MSGGFFPETDSQNVNSPSKVMSIIIKLSSLNFLAKSGAWTSRLEAFDPQANSRR